ncbi:MAG TPA: SpoIVB peptidase S55 domain-containing protein, partial [Verrucomicrobiae bacterium]|nr:SpoIVB peptidase S55 domain-containing protein [Verrucomicrobiae bacterium]
MKFSAPISGFCATLLTLLCPNLTRAADDTPIMPLSEIKPGMLGEWHSTVSGSRVDSFPMQVVGIAENFIGPQRPVIICQALDATNKLTGPVAGMSGSPVFIDGKLIGAYAYGFLWPKDQALIGVTPVEFMLEVETNYPPAAPSAGTKGLAGIENG